MNRLNAIILSGIITFLAGISCISIALQPKDEIGDTIQLETIATESETETMTETEPETTEESTVASIVTNSMTGNKLDPIIKPVVEEETVETEEITEEETTVVEVTFSVETEAPVVETKPVEHEPELIAGRVDPSLKVNKNDELSMTACIIYQEMGGDYACDECRRRVADTVLNRVASPRFPNTIYEVLTQGLMQYGFDSTTGVYWQERCKEPGEAHAVERAYRIAEEVLSGKHSDIYGKDYIWQAEFIQGVNNIYCCNTYFGQRDKNKGW